MKLFSRGFSSGSTSQADYFPLENMAEEDGKGAGIVADEPAIIKVDSAGSQKIIGEDGETMYVIDPKAERALVWKFDLRILPVLAVMYLFNALDSKCSLISSSSKLNPVESNLGNAKTAGLEDDLGLVGNQYNILLSVFFVPYVLTAPLLGIAGKKYGPNRILPVMMFTFGSMTLFVAAVHNFGGLSKYPGIPTFPALCRHADSY